MARATSALSGVPAAKPVTMPTIKELHDSELDPKLRLRAGLPNAAVERSAALACANLAVLDLTLGDTAGVEELLNRGLDFVEALAPSGPAVSALSERTRGDQRGVERELDVVLNLKGDKPKQFAALNRFKRQLTILETEAGKRQQFERELIRDIAYRGQPGLAWKIVKQRDSLDPPERRSMLSKTPLAYYIAVTAFANGDTVTPKEIEAVKPAEDKIDLVINKLVYNMAKGTSRP